MKAVIVKFHQGYSFKTERICHWCQARFWESRKDIITRYPEIEFYPTTLSPSLTLSKHIKEIFEEWK